MDKATALQQQTAYNNLGNIRDLNMELFAFGKPLISEAWLRITQKEQNGSDKGLKIMVDLLGGMMAAAASATGFPEVALMAATIPALLREWLANTPPDMNKTFADLLERYINTTEAINTQLDLFRGAAPGPGDVEKYWDATFKYNDKTWKLSALGNSHFPAKGEPQFDVMVKAGIREFDKGLWKMIIKETCAYYEHNAMYMAEQVEPTGAVSQYYRDYPAYYFKWPKGAQAGYYIHNWVLGPGGYPLPQAACEYLFIDALPGQIINPDGLFSRRFVFNDIMDTHPDWDSMDG